MGDTYETLANRTDILIRDLQAANCPEGSLTLQAGDIVYLPRDPDPAVDQATPLPTAVPTETAIPLIPTIHYCFPG